MSKLIGCRDRRLCITNPSTMSHNHDKAHAHGHGHGHAAVPAKKFAFPYGYEAHPGNLGPRWQYIFAFSTMFTYTMWVCMNHRDVWRRLGFFKTWEIRTGPVLIDLDDWEKDAEEKVYLSPDRWSQPLMRSSLPRDM